MLDAAMTAALNFGRETGVPPTSLRASGRTVHIVTGVVEGTSGVFDNGLLAGKAKVEQGIKFGPEVLRAVKGRKVLACWFAVSAREDGKPGWYGLTIYEMRIDDAQKDGFRDTGGWPGKLMDAARGRVEVFRITPEQKKGLLVLLQSRADLWGHAFPALRETVLAMLGGAAEAAAGAAASAAAVESDYPVVTAGREGGTPPRTLRAGGRNLTVAGVILDGTRAEWDNGALTGQSKAEKDITFGPEQLRALKGRRVCTVWVTASRRADGKDGWFGATVGDMRIDDAKKEGFKDLAAHGVKLSEAALGRIEVWRLRPEERKALVALLQGQADLWEFAAENFRDAFA